MNTEYDECIAEFSEFLKRTDRDCFIGIAVVGGVQKIFVCEASDGNHITEDNIGDIFRDGAVQLKYAFFGRKSSCAKKIS